MKTVVCSWVNYSKTKTILNSTVTRHIPGKKAETLKFSEDIINENLNDPQVIYLGLPPKETDQNNLPNILNIDSFLFCDYRKNNIQ